MTDRDIAKLLERASDAIGSAWRAMDLGQHDVVGTAIDCYDVASILDAIEETETQLQACADKVRAAQEDARLMSGPCPTTQKLCGAGG